MSKFKVGPLLAGLLAVKHVQRDPDQFETTYNRPITNAEANMMMEEMGVPAHALMAPGCSYTRPFDPDADYEGIVQ